LAELYRQTEKGVPSDKFKKYGDTVVEIATELQKAKQET
jgi:hypothetical protein